MNQQEASNQFGGLWSQAHTGKPQLVNSTSGVSGISPAIIAILVQLAAKLIPQLMERCGKDANELQRTARVVSRNRWDGERRIVAKSIRKELGFVKYFWHGGSKLADSAIKTAAHEQSLPLMKAFE